MHKGFLKAGHVPTLFSSFLYFDMSFMVWVPLGLLFDRFRAERVGIGGVRNRWRTTWSEPYDAARV